VNKKHSMLKPGSFWELNSLGYGFNLPNHKRKGKIGESFPNSSLLTRVKHDWVPAVAKDGCIKTDFEAHICEGKT
jgi:hypothetical protein